VDVTAPKAGCDLSAWLLTPAAFTLDGKPVEPREDEGSVALPPGATLSLQFDLEPFVLAAESCTKRDFVLGYAKELLEEEGERIEFWSKAPTGLDFMTMDEAELANYQPLLITNRGRMQFEMWPDAAPNHVRNFLDLCYTRFYEGATFHRVIPGFMIQGGDPDGTGGGSGPRTLELEISDKMHLPGVLSMARTDDPNSASCQFFVMHGAAPQLDGNYSIFGRITRGSEIVDRIATTAVRGERPVEEQVIEKALVMWRHPEDRKQPDDPQLPESPKDKEN
jgi:cyclophilin family peptidyl-prolyl cis-trans isomerase